MQPFTPSFAAAFFKHFPGWRGILAVEIQEFIQRLAAAMASAGSGLPEVQPTDGRLWDTLAQDPERLRLFLGLMKTLLQYTAGQSRGERAFLVSSLAVSAGLLFFLGMKTHLSAQSVSGFMLVIKALLDHLVDHVRQQFPALALPSAGGKALSEPDGPPWPAGPGDKED